jgi:hypothetical protein
MLPTGLAKWAAEEQMECRLLNVAVGDDTIVVISLKFLLFPSQDVSCVQSIHQEKPQEDPQFVTEFGVPNPKKRSWRLYILVRKVIAL